MARKRPRLNITLDPNIKIRAEEIAARLNLPISRLIEQLLIDFSEKLKSNPQTVSQMTQKINDRLKNSQSTASDEAIREITTILSQLVED